MCQQGVHSNVTAAGISIIFVTTKLISIVPKPSGLGVAKISNIRFRLLGPRQALGFYGSERACSDLTQNLPFTDHSSF